jgi:hypothetical protein
MDASGHDISQAKDFIAPPGYSRHRPETTLLYQLIAEYYLRFRDRRAAEASECPGDRSHFARYFSVFRLRIAVL